MLQCIISLMEDFIGSGLWIGFDHRIGFGVRVMVRVQESRL